MPPNEPLSLLDRHRLEHMRQAAEDAIMVLGSLDENDLQADMVRRRALVNCFSEIGEAAARMTLAGRDLARNVPWRQIVGMRNNIVHVYWGIDVRELVKTVRSDLPGFISTLSLILSDTATS